MPSQRLAKMRQLIDQEINPALRAQYALDYAAELEKGLADVSKARRAAPQPPQSFFTIWATGEGTVQGPKFAFHAADLADAKDKLLNWLRYHGDLGSRNDYEVRHADQQEIDRFRPEHDQWVSKAQDGEMRKASGSQVSQQLLQIEQDVLAAAKKLDRIDVPEPEVHQSIVDARFALDQSVGHLENAIADLKRGSAKAQGGGRLNKGQAR